MIKEKQSFDRLIVSKEDLLEMFEYNKYKQHIISSKIPDGTSTTVYRCGPMIDLCVGPHIVNTGRIKAMSVMKTSASYFLGNQANDSLQRLYGISFPDKKQMTEYKQFLLEAAKRDHRRIGKDQELFLFNEMSPGSCFWLPHGTRIYNTLTEFIRVSASEATASFQLRTSFTFALSVSPLPQHSQSIVSEASMKLSPPTCSIRNYGRPPVIRRTTRTACSRLLSRRRRSP